MMLSAFIYVLDVLVALVMFCAFGVSASVLTGS